MENLQCSGDCRGHGLAPKVIEHDLADARRHGLGAHANAERNIAFLAAGCREGRGGQSGKNLLQRPKRLGCRDNRKPCNAIVGRTGQPNIQRG